MSVNQSLVSEYSEPYNAPDSANGTLVIVVCRAKHLPNRRKLDKQSPYVTVRLGTVAQKTPSHFRAGQTPEWTYEMRFELTRDRKPVLKLDVLDETKYDPTPIGNTEIDCSVIFANPDNQREGKYIYDDWYDLTLNGRRAGRIYLEMTFYPSAPIVPAKIPQSYNEDFYSSKVPGSYGESHITQPYHQSNSYSKPDDIFVTSESEKKSYSFFKNSAGSNSTTGTTPVSSSHESADEEVFVSGEKEKGTKKYLSKLNKLKSKFTSKEPINVLWHSPEESLGSAPIKKNRFGSPKRSVSPISQYDPDNLDQLQRDISGPYDTHDDYDPDPGPPPPPVHKQPSHRHHNSSSDQYRRRSPSPHEAPPPPPHIVKSPVAQNLNLHQYQETRHSKSISPSRRPPADLQSSFEHLNMGPKVPPKPATTAIPFSADRIGAEDDEPIPTQVYFMGKQVKSISDAAGDEPYNLNPDEIDPRFYAPTPSEQLNHTLKLQSGKLTREELKTDFRTSKTGYLGNGKFSPSIFERAAGGNDADSDVVDDDYYNGQSQCSKPRVPPKIPEGLTEMEYYVLEKEKYLRDLQGRRL